MSWLKRILDSIGSAVMARHGGADIALKSKVADTTVGASAVTWVYTHFASIDTGLHFAIGLVTLISLLVAIRYHRVKTRVLLRYERRDVDQDSGV